jgi:phosphatidylserine decarboxylase
MWSARWKLYNEKDMVRDGIFYGLGLGVVAAAVWALTHSAALTLLPVLLALFFLWFFRDPERRIPAGLGEIVSPADGVVTEAEWIETAAGSRLRLSIFLNVFDVHVNRAPVAGTVKAVEYRDGSFLNAMKPESVIMNEQTLVVIDAGGYEVSYKQIAGLLARRIVCSVKVGDRLERGQRVGMIKFGSRTDVLMPAEAVPQVKSGARVRGGSTVLASSWTYPAPTSMVFAQSGGPAAACTCCRLCLRRRISRPATMPLRRACRGRSPILPTSTTRRWRSDWRRCWTAWMASSRA